MEDYIKIGLGTAAIGRPVYINIKQKLATERFSLTDFKKNSLDVLEDAYRQGVRFFDTSPGYGLAEELVLDLIQSKNDASISVSTKWGYTYVANFKPNAIQHEIKEHSLGKLNQQWEFSKQLLPYLKVYQIHSATFDTDVLENDAILNRLHELKTQNEIIIGLTTTGANQIEVLKKALSTIVQGEKLFQSFQCTFNILDQSVIGLKNELNKIEGPFIIKEALANGRLIPNKKYSGYSTLFAFMLSLSERYKVGPDAIALRYCIDVFPNATILSGANNSSHLTANLKSYDFKLTASEVERLSSFGVSAEEYWKERKELNWN